MIEPMIDVDVEAVHQDAVRRSSQGDLAAADPLFDDAWEASVEVYDECTQDYAQTFHMARILRDWGMHDVRVALQSEHPDFSPAQVKLGLSTEKLEGTMPQVLMSPLRPYLFSELGESISCVGRLGVAVLVKRGSPLEDLHEATIRTSFKLANARLQAKGTNKYYATSNAMQAARFERILGNGDDALDWMKEAQHELMIAALYDRRNAVRAARTYAALGLSLMTPTRAAGSVFKRP